MNDFTARDVPTALLAEACLVDWVGFRALQSDPRVSYCLYIPQAHYSARPGDGNNKVPLPLIVNVHGTERRAERCCVSLAAFAVRNRCAVLAPLFPTCIGARYDLDNYKTLRYGSVRFDFLLLDMLDEVKGFWGPGIVTDQVFMMGFSGGGQFVHRFLYLHPERLLGVSIGAPGRPTDFLDHAQSWPQGVADVSEVFEGKVIDTDRVRQVKAVQLVVGGDDTEVAGKGLFEWLATRRLSVTDDGNAATGGYLLPVNIGRRETLVKIQLELETIGVNPQVAVVPGVGHEALDMLPAVCRFWEPLLKEFHAAQDV